MTDMAREQLVTFGLNCFWLGLTLSKLIIKAMTEVGALVVLLACNGLVTWGYILRLTEFWLKQYFKLRGCRCALAWSICHRTLKKDGPKCIKMSRGVSWVYLKKLVPMMPRPTESHPVIDVHYLGRFKLGWEQAPPTSPELISKTIVSIATIQKTHEMVVPQICLGPFAIWRIKL